MDDNVHAAACGSQPSQAAKTMRLDSDQDEDVSSAPPLPSQDEEVFEEPRHPSRVLEGLNRLRLNGALCDLILCSEGQEFPCHRYVLASISSYFEAMFSSGMKECSHERVSIAGVEPQTMGLLLSYAYTSKVSISTDNVQALLAASRLWDMAAVLEACCGFMERRLDASNCVGVYCFAEAHCCRALEKRSMDFILEHFSVVYQQAEFLSLPLEGVTAVLSSDHLNVPQEDMVLEAAMLWLKQDPSRRLNFGKVLEQIRPSLLSWSCLLTVTESLDGLKDHQGVQRFIWEAREQARTLRKRKKWRRGCGAPRPGRSTVIVTMGGSGKMRSFDLQSKQWRTLGSLPYAGFRCNAVAVSGSTVYVTTFGRDMWRFDVTCNSWQKTAPMDQGSSFYSKIKAHRCLVMLGGYVYAVGGRFKSLERYHPDTNRWQVIQCEEVEAYSDARLPPVVSLDGLLYFFGGLNLRGEAQSTVECFNPQTDTWSLVSPLAEPRCEAAALVVEGRIYVLGGRDGYSRFPDSIECYCETTASWRTVGRMPSAQHGAHCALNCVSLRLRNDFPYTTYTV